MRNHGAASYIGTAPSSQAGPAFSPLQNFLQDPLTHQNGAVSIAVATAPRPSPPIAMVNKPGWGTAASVA